MEISNLKKWGKKLRFVVVVVVVGVNVVIYTHFSIVQVTEHLVQFESYKRRSPLKKHYLLQIEMLHH